MRPPRGSEPSTSQARTIFSKVPSALWDDGRAGSKPPCSLPVSTAPQGVSHAHAGRGLSAQQGALTRNSSCRGRRQPWCGCPFLPGGLPGGGPAPHPPPRPPWNLPPGGVSCLLTPTAKNTPTLQPAWTPSCFPHQASAQADNADLCAVLAGPQAATPGGRRKL